MDTTRWQRIREIFDETVELDPVRRAPFLDEACAHDLELRAQVLELLAADERAGAFIEPPSPRTLGALLGDALELPAGAHIGHWRLEQRVGTGGMGSVYRARRSDSDFEQTVAVKLVRRDVVERRDLRERFESERRTLARLKHANIAALIDGGTTDDGTPYFVMEFIDGAPIDRWCDERRLALRRRIELFRSVCDGVHFAHTNLVIHRDLKPSNILVGSDGVPRLCDFGVAKLLGRFEERSDLTRTGERPMTPEYASPEQVRGEAVTTQSDVYSLGVILYELLTGRRPYALKTRLSHELERSICEAAPERPSTRVRGVEPFDAPAGAPPPIAPEELARLRGTRVDRLKRELAGDLDTIVLKALRKEPGRRYASAQELGEDLRRYLVGLPVTARPDTLRYRAAKLLRRNRLLVAVSAAGVLALLVAIASLVHAVGLARTRMTELVALARLTDLTALEAYIAEAEDLWPADERTIPRLHGWLANANELVANLERHRARLAELRARALPYDAALRHRDVAAHPASKRIAELESQRDAHLYRLEHGLGRDDESDRRLAEAREQIAELERRIADDRSYAFEDPADQHEHDQLAKLERRLARFVEDGTIRDVERRLRFAESVHRASIEDHADAWAEAVASIASRVERPQYDGLAIVPQLGLVPLGPDPESGLWEFGHLQTGALAERDEAGRLIVREDNGIVFVLIPGGTFRMGARRPERPGERGPNVDPGAEVPQEQPVHEVALAPFFLAKHELTQGQWLFFTGEQPSTYKPGELHGRKPNDLTHPVESVSWTECERFCRKLGLRLPTEAQWEYAARAGTTTPWWTGDDGASLAGAANIADRAARAVGAPWPPPGTEPLFDDGYVTHAPVGSYRANAFGLHDVCGNVWEWCGDDFAGYDLPVRPGDGERAYKGSGMITGRGGSLSKLAQSCRVSHRGVSKANIREPEIGLRPMRELQP